MKCEACRKNKATKKYGGAMVCDWCEEFYNPPLKRVFRLSESDKQEIGKKIRSLECEISHLKRKLETDKRLFSETDAMFVDTTSSHIAAFK